MRARESSSATRARTTPAPALVRVFVNTVLALSFLAAAPTATAHGGAASTTTPDTLTIGPLTGVYWDSGALARHVLEGALRYPPLPSLPVNILEMGPPVRIFFAPDPERFDSLTGGYAPEWGAGIAIPDANMIVLPAYVSERGSPLELVRTLRHELAHIALHRYLAPGRPPRWFDEGYARIAAGEWDLEAAWQLRLAFATGRAPHLDSLDLAWPRAAGDARIAYLLATTAVAFLLDRGGENALAIFLERWKETGALEPALRRTYGLTLGQFEEDWREEVRDVYGWTYFLAHSLIFWFFGGLLVFLLYIRRRRRDRERLESLRANEPPDSPAYWLGEPLDDEPPGATGPPPAGPPAT